MISTTLPLSNPDLQASYFEQGKGEPLLLVHGVGMQYAAWGPQIDAFAKTHRVIAVNMPGHGGSSPLPKGAQLEDFVDWLHDFILNLKCGPVNLAGHSMGALIAGGYVVSQPDLVRRVALLNGVYCREKSARDAVIARAAEITQGKINLEGPLSRWFGNSPKEQEVRKKTEHWLSQMNLQSYATAYDAFAKGDATYAHRLNEINCPALFLTADGDLNSTPEMAMAMAKATSRGKISIIKGHKHMANLTTPMDVNNAIATWLKEPEKHVSKESK